MSETRYTPDDYYESAPPRIMGAECEYDLQFAGDKTNKLKPFVEYINPHTLRAVGLVMGLGERGYLSNGARLYHELGKFAEYASAEGLGPEAAVLSDKAGEVAVRGATGAARQPAEAIYRRSAVATQPGVYDSRGYHANYMIPRALNNEGLALLAAHMATRKWAGGGIVTETGYHLSQKGQGVGTTVAAKSVKEGNKTMYNQYKLSGGTTWHRFEDRCGDPLRSPAASLANFGSTSLLLRLIEHPHFSAIVPQDLPLDPVEVINQTGSFDEGSPETFRTFGGGESNWLSTQQLLIDAVTYLADEIELPEDEILALQIWQEIVDAYKQIAIDHDDVDRAAGLTDAAAKYRYLRRKFDGPLGNDRAEIVQADMAYDDILIDAVDRYWQAHLAKHPSLAGSRLTGTAIKAFVTQAPTGTAAKARGDLARGRRHIIQSWSNYANSAGLTMQLPIAPLKHGAELPSTS